MKFTKIIKASKEDFIEQLKDYLDDKMYDAGDPFLKIQDRLMSLIFKSKYVFDNRIEVEHSLENEFAKLIKMIDAETERLKSIIGRLK